MKILTVRLFVMYDFVVALLKKCQYFLKKGPKRFFVRKVCNRRAVKQM